MLNNLINFRKRSLISEIISEIQLYQQLEYPFEMTTELFSLLMQLPTNVSNDELYQLSLLREPRQVFFDQLLMDTETQSTQTSCNHNTIRFIYFLFLLVVHQQRRLNAS